MQVINALDMFPPMRKPTVAAIGIFDGLHLGHQEILRRLISVSRENGLFSLVMTFFPHPETLISGKSIPAIQTLEQRLEGIQEFGLQVTLIVEFTDTFARLSPRKFAEKVLAGTIRAKEVVVGDDFRFGRNREGDISTLSKLGAEFGFRVQPVPPISINGQIISSSLIRKLLQEGKIEEASRFFGRPYEIRGTVVKGHSRGNLLGFPTANVEVENDITPTGVFITAASLESGTWPSLTNVGTRPTFGQKDIRTETHIFNFTGILYGKKIKIRFLKKIREERKFRSPEKLKAQIKKDVEAAASFFQSAGYKGSFSRVHP